MYTETRALFKDFFFSKYLKNIHVKTYTFFSPREKLSTKFRGTNMRTRAKIYSLYVNYCSH